MTRRMVAAKFNTCKTVWNDERNQEVMRSVLGGETYVDVAARHGISKNRVKEILLGCARRGYFRPDQKRMWGIYRRLYGTSSWNRIKRSMSGAPDDSRWQAMLKTAQKQKVEKRAKYRLPSNAFRDAMIIGWLTEMTPRQAAEAAGLDVQRIYQIRKKHREKQNAGSYQDSKAG